MHMSKAKIMGYVCMCIHNNNLKKRGHELGRGREDLEREGVVGMMYMS